MEIKLENESLELTINSFGAELKSITGKETGTQYLWDADEKYWKRSAPVLFPFVSYIWALVAHAMGNSCPAHGLPMPTWWAADARVTGTSRPTGGHKETN